MGTLVAIVGSIAVAGVLVAAGGSHLRHQTALRAALDGHRLWPRTVTPGLAGAVAVIELGVGAAMGVGIVLERESTLLPASLAAAALFAAYAVYSAWLWRARPTASCGCDNSGDPATPATVARAAILAVTAIGAAAFAGSIGDPIEAYQAVTGVLAGAAWGTIVWSLPTALAVPAAHDRAGRAAY